MRDLRRHLGTWPLMALAHDTFWLEVCLGATAVGWAGSVWWMRGDLVDRVAYAAAARFAPDGVWEAMGLLGGLVQLVAAFHHHRVIRWALSLIMAGFWLVLADGVHASSLVFTPSVVPYYALAAFNGICLALPLARRMPWLLRQA